MATSGMQAVAEGDNALSLRPFEEADRAILAPLLAQPRLYRRKVADCVCERPRIGWSAARRTFVVSFAETMLGVAELVRDEREPDVWSLAVTLDHHVNQGDGGRCAATLVDYAFRSMNVASVCFWVRRDNIAVQCFSQRLGFTRMVSLKSPSGAPGDYYEVDRAGWEAARAEALAHYLRQPVAFSDGVHHLRGEHGEFHAVRPASVN